jgi:hypothetical protein
MREAELDGTTHARIMEKLGARNAADLVRIVMSETRH